MENERKTKREDAVYYVNEDPETGVPERVGYTLEYWVGKRTRQLREERQWSQGELAHRMADAGFEMHQTTVAKLEAGSRPIRVNEVAALAGVFGVSLLDMFNKEQSVMQLNEDPHVLQLREIRRWERELDDARVALDAANQSARMAEQRVDIATAKLTEAQAAFRGLKNG